MFFGAADVLSFPSAGRTSPAARRTTSTMAGSTMTSGWLASTTRLAPVTVSMAQHPLVHNTPGAEPGSACTLFSRSLNTLCVRAAGEISMYRTPWDTLFGDTESDAWMPHLTDDGEHPMLVVLVTIAQWSQVASVGSRSSWLAFRDHLSGSRHVMVHPRACCVPAFCLSRNCAEVGNCLGHLLPQRRGRALRLPPV